MTISTTKKMVLGAAVGLAGVVAMLAPAAAHGRHHRHHHHHFRHWHAPVFITESYGSCHYLYRKWRYTGSRYWKFRYFDCIGG